MTREEAMAKLRELSCSYQHIRMTDCPHCVKEVESLLKALVNPEKGAVGGEGLNINCPRCREQGVIVPLDITSKPKPRSVEELTTFKCPRCDWEITGDF